jgi:hypothetical protein
MSTATKFSVRKCQEENGRTTYDVVKVEIGVGGRAQAAQTIIANFDKRAPARQEAWRLARGLHAKETT